MHSMRFQVFMAVALLGFVGCSASESPDSPQRLGTAHGALSTCVTVQRGGPGDVADAPIASNQATKTHGGKALAHIGSHGGGTEDLLLRPDVSAIPPWATVESATLTLWQANDGDAVLGLHRVTAPWGEASVTWSSFAGAFDPTVLASTSNGGTSYEGPVDFDLTAIAQQWVSHQAPNHGVLVEQDTSTTDVQTSEHGNAAHRPRLEVCYTAPAEGPDQPAGTSLLLHVLDADGAPIPSAAVTPSGAAGPIPTDGAGYLLLDQLAPGRFSARVERYGYAPATVAVDLPQGAHGGAEVRLLPLSAPVAFDAASGATVDVGEVYIDIPPNALVDRNGEPVSGEVEVTVVPLDPSAGLQTVPGPLEGETAGGGAVALESLAMAEVTVWQNGLPLQLAPGQTASLEMVLPAAPAADLQPGEIIPAWWLDLDAGMWREDGAGVVQPSLSEPGRLAWVAEVEHFTWWNCDRPWTDKNCFIVPVLSVDGSDVVPNETVGAVGVSYTGESTPKITDEYGLACVDIMLGGTATIFVGPSIEEAFDFVTITGTGPAGDCGGNGATCVTLNPYLAMPLNSICTPGEFVACLYAGPPGTEGVGICQAPTKWCNGSGTAYSACIGEVTPQPESCQTPTDDDCDGLVNEEGNDCSCKANTTAVCYTGPTGTLGMGICVDGTRTCASDGLGYGPCIGQVTPQPEDCSTTGVDESCNGVAACVCGDDVPDKVACWPLDETSGTNSVEFVAGINGTWFGGPTPTVGVQDGALAFDGVNDYVLIPSVPALNFGTGDFSISFYVRTTTLHLTALIDKRIEWSGPVRGWVAYAWSGYLGFQLSDGAHTNFTTSAFIADDQWHHVAITVDRDQPTGLKIYVDKALHSVWNPTGRQGSLSNTISMTMGRRSDGSPGWFSGALDQVKLFNRVLTNGEVQSL